MSLAAALSAGGGRPASFLPAIKCSSCGDEIEIASMGDHVCGKQASSTSIPADTSNPFTLRQMNATGQTPANMPVPLQYPTKSPPKTRLRAPTIGSQNAPVPKPPRTAPPRINPDAANQPFLAPQFPRSQTPVSPALSTRSGSSNSSRPPPPRSMTSPMPRVFDMRPPSPELTGGFDSPFPVFPTPRSGSGSRPGTSNGRKTPSGERSASRGGLRPERPAGDPINVDMPKSPMQSNHMLQRMNTLKSGPFEAGRRRASRDEKLPPMPLSARRPSAPAIGPAPIEPLPPTPAVPLSSQNADAPRKEPPQRPARPQEDVLSPTFLDTFSKEPETAPPSTFPSSQEPTPLSKTDRSKTFPLRQESSDTPGPVRSLARMPSEPALRPGRQRRPTLTAGPNTAPSQVPQVEPPRSMSRNGTRMDYRLQDAPPVPKPVQERRAEFSHAPSESSSSAGSTHRSYTESSSGPSPITSAASSVDAFSPLRDDMTPYGEDERMRVAGLSVKGQQKPGMRAEQPLQRSPSKSHRVQRSLETQVIPETPTTMPSLTPLLESPMDPEMHKRTQSPYFRAPDATQSPTPDSARPDLARTPTPPMPIQAPATTSPQKSLEKPQSADDYDPYRAPTPQPPALSQPTTSLPSPQPPALDRITSRSPRPFSPANSSPFPPPPPSTSTTPRPQPTRRATAGVKAVCRGCSLTIEGKSVKAADGRLTGRWHKQCFTCRTCAQPFATADFYVIENQPYCEHHYHEANGSLCAGCTRGIEGQYLETTSSSGMSDRKFHPRCFTCVDCRVVLNDDYFEIGGRVYCERDALRAMRGQARLAGPGINPANQPGPMGRGGGQGQALGLPGRDGLKAERRTTRLMMM